MQRLQQTVFAAMDQHRKDASANDAEHDDGLKLHILEEAQKNAEQLCADLEGDRFEHVGKLRQYRKSHKRTQQKRSMLSMEEDPKAGMAFQHTSKTSNFGSETAKSKLMTDGDDPNKPEVVLEEEDAPKKWAADAEQSLRQYQPVLKAKGKSSGQDAKKADELEALKLKAVLLQQRRLVLQKQMAEHQQTLMSKMDEGKAPSEAPPSSSAPIATPPADVPAPPADVPAPPVASVAEAAPEDDAGSAASSACSDNQSIVASESDEETHPPETKAPVTAAAWNQLGRQLSATEKVTFDGVSYGKVECFIQALQLRLQFAPAWNNLGIALEKDGQIVVDGESYTKRQCFLQSIKCDPKFSRGWHNLGYTLAHDEQVTVNGTPHARKGLLHRGSHIRSEVRFGLVPPWRVH